MLELALLGGGIGALIGGAIMTTEKGQEINRHLEDAWDKYRNDIITILTICNTKN